jgi:hypothetical protein
LSKSACAFFISSSGFLGEKIENMYLPILSFR